MDEYMKTWIELLFGWISIWLLFTLLLLHLNRQLTNILIAKGVPSSVVRLWGVTLDFIILRSLKSVQLWFEIDFLDVARSIIIPNLYIFAVYQIFGHITLISLPIGFVVAVAEHWVIGYVWELQQPLLVGVGGILVGLLWFMPQLYDTVELALDFWIARRRRIEKPKDGSYIRSLEEYIVVLEGKLKTKTKYIEQLTNRKKNEHMMRPVEQIGQCKHKDIENEMMQMEKKLKELEIVAKNAVEERGKVERQKEELEQTVKQLKQIQDGVKKKHKTEILSQKENLSRAVSHSRDLKEKVAALREENVKLRSVQDELTALQGKFQQVEKNLENECKRHKNERNSLLANNQKIKEDLNSCLSEYKLLKDQMDEFELKAAVSPPPSKQLDDIFESVKQIFPTIERDTVVSELVDLKGGKAATVERIVKSLDDKIGTQKAVPCCSQSECPICLLGIDVVKCEKCKQKFHTECLTEWLNNHQPQCPMCRAEWISE